MLRTSELLLALIVLADPGAVAGTWRGSMAIRGDVAYVSNPATSVCAPETLDAEVLWRRNDVSDDHVLGRVDHLAAGADGCSYLLDAQLAEVAVYSPDGIYLRSLGRQGDGPGEFRRRHDLVVRDDGSVFVLQLFPGRITALDAAGTPLPAPPVPPLDSGNTTLLWAAEPSPAGLVMHRYQVLVDGEGGLLRTDALAAVDERGDVVATYCDRVEHRRPGDTVRDEGVYGKYLSEWHVGPGGEVVVRTAWHGYELTVYEPGGGIARVVSREYAPRRRRPEVVAALQRYYDERFAGRRWRGNVGPIEYRASDRDGDIQLFAVRPDGYVWVLTSRGALDAPPGILGTFDVLDPEGRFVRQVSLRGDGDFWQDLYVVSRDRLYVVTNHGTAVPGWHRSGVPDRSEDAGREIICYRLPR